MAKRKFHRKIYQESKKRKKIISILKFSVCCFFLAAFAALSLIIYYIKDFPNPEKFTERPYIQSTKIYDRTGEILLYDIYGEEKRTVIPLSSMPEHLKQAVIACEDANFYNHKGIDPKAIGRSILINLKLKKPAAGGSTISQQLIRSSFLTLEKTIKRKTREIVSTFELERRYSKEQILEFYLNQVPFGSNCYGVESASQTFFKKSASEISLEEAAILASLVQAPSYLSPYGKHKDELLARKDYVLDRMAKCDYMSAEQAEAAKKQAIEFSEILRPIKAPHFVFYVKEYLEQKYGKEFLKEKGLKVYTSLDWELQQIAEQAIRQGAANNEANRAFNAAMVALSPQTGEILAMVGSKDWHADENYPKDCISKKNCLFEPEFNIVASALRQPGSAFKPFVYAAAFEMGYTPETILWDAKTNFGVWGAKSYIPQNYNGKFQGPINLRHALAQSINVPSVKILYLAGLENTISLAKKLGITTLNEKPSHYGLSLVLGGGAVKLLDITSAYGVFATQGLKIPPVSILKIEDRDGNIIEENKKTLKRVLNKETANLINDILSDNKARAPLFGFNSPLYFENYQIAAKTGTTQEYKDAWTIGYSPLIVTGVWAGNNDNTPTLKPGASLAAPIWHNFMEQALSKYPKQEFEKPSPIITEKPILNGEIDQENPHSILHYIIKDNPHGAIPENPKDDSQYSGWERAIKTWLILNPKFLNLE